MSTTMHPASSRLTKLVELVLELLLGELLGVLLPNTGDISSEELNADGVFATVSGVKLLPPLLEVFLTGVL
jgi:hypothetical protein